MAAETETHLNRTLGPIFIWALGVGYVISGMYFGWNLGLPLAGPYGFLLATLVVTLMYVTFVLGYAELTCMMPRAGGAFAYASYALGPRLGFLTGVAQWIEFVFAPPAIAAAIGAYFNIFFPAVPVLVFAMLAYLVFTGLNIYGVKQSAIFELCITILAVVELMLFFGICMPSFSWAAFSIKPLPNGWIGVFPALPYAIWFYLGIEGLANIAEESRNPQKDLSRGFSLAMGTLVLLALMAFFGAVGVAGWEAVVYKMGPAGQLVTSDSPLPMALGKIVGENHFFYHLLVTVGIFGLIASFHGIILAAGRVTMEFGRVGYAPKIIGHTLPGRQTPGVALLLNMGLGMIALLTGKTAEIITLAVFGAITLYLLSMISLFKLRDKFPDMPRPFKTPGYPAVPAIALVLSTICLWALVYYNAMIAGIYFTLVALAMAAFSLVPESRRQNPFLIQEHPLHIDVEPRKELSHE